MPVTLPGLSGVTATPRLLGPIGAVLPPPPGGGGNPPEITGFTPSEGPVDTAVTITGQYFSTTARVLFNGTASTNWKIDSDTQITAHVPDGATTGRIEVAAGGGDAYTGAGFTVTHGGGGGGGGGGNTDLSGCVAPCRNDLQYLRNDQGLDVISGHDFLAMKAGTISKIDHGWAGGTGIGLYLTFDEPVKVLGTTYKQQYIAEGKPSVKLHDHVPAGKHLVQNASVEFGFWPSPLIGGLGAGSQPTQQSYDFAWTLRQLGIDLPDSALGPNLGKDGGGGGKQPAPGPQPGQGVQSAWDDVLHVYSRKVPKAHETIANFDDVLIGVFK